MKGQWIDLSLQAIMSKPSLPQGTRDFGAAIVLQRQYIFNTIRTYFELFGFEPLETPAMENLNTLMGKYGDEGDKLIFRILNNGLERPEKHSKAREDFELILQGKNVSGLTERALRYDLTIPFARYVAMNHGKLSFPFKRYQMQPVWRADRPQKGRYREFYQCDADIVGSDSLWCEIDLAHLYASIFSALKIPVEIRINNRKILTALAESCGASDKLIDITTAIDKLDKIGLEKVLIELEQRGLSAEQSAFIQKYLQIEGDIETQLSQVKALLSGNDEGKQGIEELEVILNACTDFSASQKLIPDFTLARGLSYYTGTIFEVKAIDVKIGSIGGGGRYNDLTGLFGVPGIAGVGISFGVDRIYDVLEELQAFPENITKGTEFLFFNLGGEPVREAFRQMNILRQAGIKTELFHESIKMDKQFKYAEKKNIPFVIILGDKELETRRCNIKNIQTGQQENISISDLAEKCNLLLKQENV